MTYFLPMTTDADDGGQESSQPSAEQMADLKVFWGPEICRLEYLVHLLETGRIKDTYEPDSA